MSTTHMITGAFGFSGSRIAARLLEAGPKYGEVELRTLTQHPRRAHPLSARVQAWPYDFDDPGALRAALEGVDVLTNTYWVRFGAAGFSQERAVQNTKALFDAARDVGVKRVVHVSITQPDEASPFAYFRCKAQMERALEESGLEHTILRPAVIYGAGDVLVNNIAWVLRRFPVFGLFGDGSYRIRPIWVEDFAQLAVRAGRGECERVVDALGPDDFSYREMVEELASALNLRRCMLQLPAWSGVAAARALGCALGDVLLTREEIGALMDGLLATDSPAVGEMRLGLWAHENAAALGRSYASELSRRPLAPRPALADAS